MPAEIKRYIVSQITTRRIDPDMKILPLFNQLDISDIDVVRIASQAVFGIQAVCQNEFQIGKMDHSEYEPRCIIDLHVSLVYANIARFLVKMKIAIEDFGFVLCYNLSAGRKHGLYEMVSIVRLTENNGMNASLVSSVNFQYIIRNK